MTQPPLRILLVDDNPAIHEDFRKVHRPPRAADPTVADLEAALFEDAPRPAARQAHIEIESAHQGADAVAMVAAAKAANAPFALAFVDVRMPPGMDGIETVARLWEVDPALQAVICTAYSDHTWSTMVEALERTDQFLVLKKPFDPIEVLQLTASLTAKWRLARAVEGQIHSLESAVAQRTENLHAMNVELRSEVAARRHAEDELRRLATHDTLTDLPNRLMLQDRIVTALARGKREKTPFGVMLIDLDGFKEINDSLGHAAGDDLLRQTARRLEGAVRDSDTVGRMGGDEFIIIAEQLAMPEDVALVAQRVVDALSRPALVNGRAVHATPSVGIALWPSDGADAERLLKCADLAMYQAKEAGGAAYRFFDERMLENSIHRLNLRTDLATVIEDGQLSVHYQPLVDIRRGGLRGMEALLRWNHPKHGMIPPLEFIPEAERSGMIIPIGAWVLETSCRQLARWHDAMGSRDLTVAVNISARQLRDASFIDTVQRVLSETGLEPGNLELEITESAAFEDEELAKTVLARLADAGVRILIDDFGAGFSSLNRLKSLPVDGLKIDRLFLKNIVDDPRDAAIVRAIIGMAHSLGIDVVAEGIETEAQLERLRTLKWEPEDAPICDRAQGYFLGRPVPVEQATDIILTTKWPVAEAV